MTCNVTKLDEDIMRIRDDYYNICGEIDWISHLIPDRLNQNNLCSCYNYYLHTTISRIKRREFL